MKIKKHPTTKQPMLDWDNNPITDGAVTYRVYYFDLGTWKYTGNPSVSEWLIPSFLIGRSLRVTAINKDGVESAPSESITVTI